MFKCECTTGYTCPKHQGQNRGITEPVVTSDIPAEALLWLAALEKDCDTCINVSDKEGWGQGCPTCSGTGKVPVLDLRERCPCPPYCVAYRDSPDDMDWQRCSACSLHRSKTLNVMGQHGDWCENCQGRTWMPTQGRQAVQDAMLKDGWDVHTSHYTITNNRSVGYWRLNHGIEVGAYDADDHIAAYKALRLAGHGGEHGDTDT